jgi:hypothetical protein
MKSAVNHVRSYDGENLLRDAVADVQAEIAADVERTLSRAQGRWIVDAEQRKALEDYGMRKAMTYFKGEGFAVEDVSKRKSYDVCCIKDATELFVEVKTTTTSGEEVVLTRREAEMKGNRALFIVHSVTLGRGKPKGGPRQDC